MKKIDNETVRKILDAADIVEVVSDFVKLRRSGANYKGLCPFHNERTPSFSVNRSRNICKCFSCGKGGSPVNFIMELEQLSYQEALRYLAKKYNIEIVEHDISDAERQEDNDRQAMLALNEFALTHYEHNLTETEQGRDVGLAYFRHRGINDAMIARFHLGWASEGRSDLTTTALAKGFNEKYLVDTGLAIRPEQGKLYDRFRARVIYPVHSVSGRVVAFGGRTLRSDKEVAKYINSPESLIYSKSHELYGLYQAKHAISRRDKCILVEGYMDVISMHQAGVENVVASSGTSLTEGQIKMIQRFSRNVTVIYDSDPAGIKASLRGIDMLLRADLDIKVVLLPEGDDPDSFAQSHSSSEVEAYIAAHEEDFIRFKTRILLADSGDDPLRRAEVINSVLGSIAVIPQEVKRVLYISECARMFGVADDVLSRQVAVLMGKKIEEDERNNRREQNMRNLQAAAGAPSPATAAATASQQQPAPEANHLEPFEREVIRYLLRYAFYDFCMVSGLGEDLQPMSVYDFVLSEFQADEINFSVPQYRHAFEAIGRLKADGWQQQRAEFEQKCAAQRQAELAEGEEQLRLTGQGVADIQAREKKLHDDCNGRYNRRVADFCAEYVQRILLSADDDLLRRLTTDLTTDRHQLSKVHTKYSKVESERDRLPDLVKRAVYELKDAIVAKEMHSLRQALTEPGISQERTEQLLEQLAETQALRNELAKYLGERIITPVIFK